MSGDSRPEQLAVVGQGYVGLPVAMRAVAAGFDVVGFDLDEHRIASLVDARSIVEDVADGEVAAALESARYRPTADADDLAGFDVAIVSVPTPLRDGNPDLSHIEAAAETLGQHLRAGACVILESTTWPGTTEELVGPVLEAASGLTVGADFALGYSPERIDPGNAEWPFERVPKVVSGATPACCRRVVAVYDRLVDRTVPVSGTREAELTKLLENTFRHVNIALINELAVFAHDLGIDIWEAIEAADTKPFGYLRFTPGPGVGGHCLPVDPSYLSWRVRDSLGQPFRFVELANDINAHMPDYVVRRVVELLNDRSQSVRGRTILLAGLAYKRNTGDARETPAIHIARQLHELGAHVWAADPLVASDALGTDVRRVELTADVVGEADGAVLLVDHDAFDLDLLVDHAGWVLDTRHALDGPHVAHL